MHTLNLQPLRKRSAALAISAVLLAASGFLSGCGGALGGGGTTGTTPIVVKYQGNVHGGQQPVANATIQLYAVGTSGLKSSSTPMLTSTVTTDSNGNFAITGLYDCTTLPATQVYITATGGNPGSGANTAANMMTALGPCSSLTPTTFIHINELTTVAAAYALAPFAADYTHIGASGSNPVGLVNAFANANSLVNVASGAAGGASLPAGATVPVTELNTLADILAACINTNGDTTSAMPCGQLFTATGATETVGAAFAIAANPSAAAITALYSLPTGAAPFQPTLSSQPKDFTVAINYNASGTLSTPWGIAIDGLGNAWVTNESGTTITEFTPSGATKDTSAVTGLVGPQGIAVDSSGNVWVANTAAGNAVKVTVSNGDVKSAHSYGAGAGPVALAIDGGGTVYVANFDGNTVTHLNSAGTLVATFTGGGSLSVPTAIALDTSNNLYVTTGGIAGGVLKLTTTGPTPGTVTSTLTDNALQGPMGIATDGLGHIVVTGSTTGSTQHGALSEYGAAGAAVSGFSPVETGLSNPTGVDLSSNTAWIANSTPLGGLTRQALTESQPSSPAGGYGSLDTPIGVAVDASGSVWTTNSGSNTVSKFIGLTNPVIVPIAARLTVPM